MEVLATPTIDHQPADFWDSQEVVDHLKKALAYARRALALQTTAHTPSSPVELRQAFSSFLADYEISQLGEKERSRYRNLLILPLKGLIRLWKRRMEATHGRSFWERAKEATRGDNRTQAWIDLLHEVANGHNQDALDDLEDLRTMGMKWQRATGREAVERYADYGLEYIWVVTRLVETKLSSDAPAATKSINRSPQPIAGSGNRPRLAMKLDDFGQLELRYRMKEHGKRQPEVLTGRPKQLLMILASKKYRDERNGWDEFIWYEIWNPTRDPKKKYERAKKKDGRDDGVNKRISKLVEATIEKLDTLLHKPPRGCWIQRLQQEGTKVSAYKITDSVIPFLDNEEFDDQNDRPWRTG